MTSFQKQLKKLKKAPTQASTVERDYSSLLFTKREAAGHDKEEYYKIGLLIIFDKNNLIKVKLKLVWLF